MANIERIFYINDQIEKDGCITIDKIASKFEVSERQIKRDIEFMRYRLNAPIFYDRKKKIYFYDKPYDSLNFHNEKTLLTFIFFKNIIKNSNYLPCYYEKINNIILENLPEKLMDIAENFILYNTIENEEINLDFIRKIVESKINNNLINIEYCDIKIINQIDI